ncbi:MAG: peptidoglycan-binding domain-containing protein, partial [Nostoc sp.]
MGYYSGVVNGQYNASTEIAVAKFQKAKGLKVDGITGLATKVSLQAAMVSKNQIITSPIVTSPAATSNPTAKPKPTERGFVWWLIFA